MNSLSMTARWFPFKGSFFAGMKFGTQDINAQRSQTLSTTLAGTTVSAKTDLEVNVAPSYYTPHVGWRWLWDSGFFFGVDTGWQFASGAQTKITPTVEGLSSTDLAILLNSAEFTAAQNDVKKVGNDIGNKALPNITFVRFGWLF